MVEQFKLKHLGIRSRRASASTGSTRAVDNRYVWGYNPIQDDRSDWTQSRPLHGDINPHVQWTPVLLSEALLAHDVLRTILTPNLAQRNSHLKKLSEAGTYETQHASTFFFLL